MVHSKLLSKPLRDLSNINSHTNLPRESSVFAPSNRPLVKEAGENAMLPTPVTSQLFQGCNKLAFKHKGARKRTERKL